jgi:hypothetical protein
MFAIDPSISDLKIRERNLIKVLFSMNIHQVANPEMSLEEARSYVFFFREGGKLQAYVGLYLVASDRRLYYTHSSNPFPEKALDDVEEEARAFAEDLGALLDEIDFGKLSREEKNRWIDDQEMFSGRKDPDSGQEPESAGSQPAAAVLSVAGDQHVVQPRAVPSAAVPSQQPEPVVPPVQPMSTPGGIHPQPVSLPAAQQQPAPMGQPAVSPATPEPGVRSVQAEALAMQTPPAPAVQAPQAAVRKTPGSQSVSSAPRRAEQPDTSVANEEETPGPRVDDLLEEAVKAGVVKAPNAKLKKDIRSANGIVSRDKEALARLLASF